MKKKEKIFIMGILILSIILGTGLFFVRQGNYGKIKITVNGKEYGTYSLQKEQIIKINETNTCEIKDGKVQMIHATCPDKLCLKQKAIDHTGGTIICLPNKVMIEGEKTAKDSKSLDAVT